MTYKKKSSIICGLLLFCLLLSQPAFAEDQKLTDNELDLKVDRLEKGTNDNELAKTSGTHDESLFNPFVSPVIKEKMMEKKAVEEKRTSLLFATASPKPNVISDEALFLEHEETSNQEKRVDQQEVKQVQTVGAAFQSGQFLPILLLALSGLVILAGLIGSYKLYTRGEHNGG